MEEMKGIYMYNVTPWSFYEYCFRLQVCERATRKRNLPPAHDNPSDTHFLLPLKVELVDRRPPTDGAMMMHRVSSPCSKFN